MKTFIEYSDEEWGEILKRAREQANRQAKQVVRSLQLMQAQLGPFIGPTQKAKSPFVGYAKTLVNDLDLKLQEKMQILFLVAVQSEYPGKVLTGSNIRNALFRLTTGKIENCLETNGFFTKLVEENWNNGVENQFRFSSEEFLVDKVDGMSASHLHKIYLKLKTILVDL
jgi:hypothetical protein